MTGVIGGFFIVVGAMLGALPTGFGQGRAVPPSPMPLGHPPLWVSNRVIDDGCTPFDGMLKELGITNSGTPFCISDEPTANPYHQAGLGANSPGLGSRPVMSPFLSPFDYGCKGDGVTDDTACLLEAVQASARAGIPLMLGRYLYKTQSLSLPPYAQIIGAAMGFYPSGQIANGAVCISGLVASSANQTFLVSMSHDDLLQSFCIKDAAAGANTSGKAISTEEVCGTSGNSPGACPESYNNTVDHVLVDGACIGLAMSGQFNNSTNNWFGNIQPGGSIPFTYCGGVRVGAYTNSNRTIQPMLYNNNVFTNYANPAKYALLIMDAGGPYLTNNEWNVSRYNVWLHPDLDPLAHGAQNIQAVNSTADLHDWAADANLQIDCNDAAFGLSNGGSILNGDWFGSAGRATTGRASAPGISISGGASGCHVLGLQINNARVSGSRGDGIDVMTSTVWDLSITNSHICAVGYGGGSGLYGINLASGVGITKHGTMIQNNKIGPTCDGLSGAMTTALNLGGNNADLVITGNDFSDAPNAYALGSNTPSGNSLVEHNKGIDDVAFTASTLTSWPLNPTIHYTGTGTLALPPSPYCCPRKTLIPTAANLTLSGGSLSIERFTAMRNRRT